MVKKNLLMITLCLSSVILFAQTIPQANLKLWLNAGKGISQSDSKVSAWTDQVGGILSATQGTLTKQPVFVENAVNGYPAVLFDGIDDFMNFQFPINNLTNATIFIVAFDTTGTSKENLWGDAAPLYWKENGGGWGSSFLGVTNNRVSWRFGVGETVGADNWNANQADIANVNGFRVAASVMDGAHDTIYVDGIGVAGKMKTNDSIRNCADAAFIGKGNGDKAFKGLVAEIIIYAATLNDNDRKAVEAYLMKKYAKKTQPALWLKADAGVTAVDGAVSDWKDQSGNNITALQSTLNAQPTLVTSAVTGLPAIQFDGIKSYMGFPFPINSLTNATVFVVAYDTTGTSKENLWGDAAPLYWKENGGGWGSSFLGVTNNRVSWRFGVGEAAGADNWNANQADITNVNGFRVATSVMNGAYDTVYVDGIGIAGKMKTNDSIRNCADAAFLGRGNGDKMFKGQIAEIRIYKETLSDSERSSIEAELMAKYVTKTQPILWLKADAGVTTIAGAVSEWKDQSGNNISATQSAVAAQPKLVVSSKTGLSAIQFDGVNDNLSFTLPINRLKTATIILVAFDSTSFSKENLWGDAAPLYWGEFGGGWGSSFLGVTNNNVIWRFGVGETAGADNWNANNKENIGVNGFRVAASVMTGAYDTVFVDGVGVAGKLKTSDSIKNCADVAFIGKGNGGKAFKGQIAEIRVYNSALGLTELKAISAELMTKYNNGFGVPSVSISSVDTIAMEKDQDTASIKISRTITDITDTVKLSVGGTSVSEDWTTVIPTQVVFEVGDSEKSISLKPATDKIKEGLETLIFTLEQDPSYLVSVSQNTVTVTIKDDFSDAIDAKELSDFNVYPNPSNGYFKVSLTGSENKISITDISGRTISENVVVNSSLWVSPLFSKGMYIISVSNAKGVVTKKLIVK